MISLTERAIDRVRQFIGEQEEPYAGIRVRVVAGGCSGFEYKMNLEQTGSEKDQVLNLDGVKVFVDEESMLYLDGTQIDFVESVKGSGFAFQNPNAKGTCGCGESFNA